MSSNIEKELLKFWKIKSVTERDGSLKKHRPHMYKEWTSDGYYAASLHSRYYVERRGYTIRWTSFFFDGDTLWEDFGETSLVQSIEEKENGFVVYTLNSIYEFEKTDVTFESMLAKLKAIELSRQAQKDARKNS